MVGVGVLVLVGLVAVAKCSANTGINLVVEDSMKKNSVK